MRKLTLETELSPSELLRQVGVVDDPDKKYRDTINFWRWRAKRKIEAESAGYYEDSKNLQFGIKIFPSPSPFRVVCKNYYHHHHSLFFFYRWKL